MRIKKFLGLSTLTRADLQLLLDVTAEMKKIVLSKNKRQLFCFCQITIIYIAIVR